MEAGSQYGTPHGGPPEQELLGGIFPGPLVGFRRLQLLFPHVFDSPALDHVTGHVAMGLRVASTDEVEVGPDVIQARLSVLDLDPTVPTEGLLGLLALTSRNVDGGLVKCLHIVETLKAYSFVQRKRGQGGHHGYENRLFVVVRPGGSDIEHDFQ